MYGSVILMERDIVNENANQDNLSWNVIEIHAQEKIARRKIIQIAVVSLIYNRRIENSGHFIVYRL